MSEQAGASEAERAWTVPQPRLELSLVPPLIPEQGIPIVEDIGEVAEHTVYRPDADGWVKRHFEFPAYATLTPEQAEDRIQRGFAEVDRLAGYIRVPKYRHAIEAGSDGQRPGAKISVLGIEGVPLDVLAERPEGAALIEDEIENLTHYFGDAFEAGRDVVDDIIKPEQYTYGVTNKGEAPQILLHDVEPYLIVVDQDHPSDQIKEVIDELILFIIVMEDASDTTFRRARRLVGDVIRRMQNQSLLERVAAHQLMDTLND